MPTGATTVWTVAGGTIISSANDNIIVSWQNVGVGSIGITVQLTGSTISKSLCIEKVEGPKAYFEIATQTNNEYFETCSQQTINFINLSSPNNGSALDRYLWDFGDGNFSSAFEPTHIYQNEGDYTVTLLVFNECNCSEKYQMKVSAKRRGVEISCPTVVCEGQSAIYSLPFDANNLCNGILNWSVIGGQIISLANGNAEIIWNQVDASGFGYVTFDPSNCDVDCREATTVKVPVIQSHGTIQGPTELCLKEQGHYKLPQWPTTDIQWEIVGNNNNTLGQIILTDQRNEIVLVPYVSGNLILRAVYTNTLLQCSGEAEIKITVAEPLQILGINNICQNNSATFTNSQNVSVNWTLKNNSGNTIATTTAVNLTYLFTQPGSYTISVDSPNFCQVDDKTIVVLAKPQAPNNILGPIDVCPSTPYSYSIPNPDPNSTYTWVVTNGNVLGSNTGEEVNITFNGTFPATISVIRKTTNPIECVSDPKIITVNKIPVNATISQPSSIVCSSSSHIYKAFKTGTNILFNEGDSYTWSISNPTLGSVISGQGTTEVEILWNEVNQVETVNLILTIGKCTLNPSPQFIKTITINPKTQIKITTSQNPVCAGSLYPVTYTVSSINGVPLNPLTDSVTWNLGNGEYTTAPGVFTQNRTFTNSGTTNIDYIITAVIANSNGCGSTNKATFTTTVLPNPPAVASISSLGNAFCLASEVNTQISVSSNTVGVTFQWYKNGIIIPGQTGTTLQVGAALNFGAYTFRATNANGCIMVSNTVNIFQYCPQPGECTISASVQNTSSLTSCGTITMSATTNPAPISSSWSVLGTGNGNYTVSGNTITGKPGMYTIIYKTKYPCLEGGTGEKSTSKQVIIPYAPDFSYITECNPNNTFNVNFIDNSNFFEGLTTKNIRFYYKAVGASSFTGPIAYNPALNVFEIQNLAAGAYVFRIENDGSYQSTSFPVCSKEYTVNLQGVDDSTSINVNGGINVKCHDSAVIFELTPSPQTGSTVLWDFGDGAKNSSLNPQRVFSNSDSTYIVTCTITNAFGCSIVKTASVYIPKECFFGDIIATPANATVCKDQTVMLTYIPDNDNCTVANYIWMNGSNTIPGAPNTSSISVSEPGSYWVKVKNIDECEYNAPTKVTPTFKKLPNVKIKGQPRYCENESIVLTAETDATAIIWKIDGVVQPQFNNMAVADFSNMFSAANFEISCTVTADNCSNTAYHTLTIEETIEDIMVDVEIICTPYYHAVLTAYAVTYSGNPVHFNWSNGGSGWSNEPNGNVTTVIDGGAFSVTGTYGGGCTFTKQIDIPKSPENYMWVFPTGCYSDCIRSGNYLIGPLVPLSNWSWNESGQPVTSGSGTTDTFLLSTNGNISLSINTGECDLQSDELSFTTDKCKKCKIEEVNIKEVVKNEVKYCSYTQTIVIYSDASQPFQATLSDPLNNVTIIPSTFTLVPGQNIIQVTIVPNSPFTGGVTTWRIHGQITDKDTIIDCEYFFQIEIPYCENMVYEPFNEEEFKENETSSVNDCMLYPNPANGTVHLQYALDTPNGNLEMYDLTGRLVSQQVLSAKQGTTVLDISNHASGMYIVIIRKDNHIKFQQKLIIN